MKHLLTFTLLFTLSVSFATIRRVNNNPGVTLVSGLVYSSLDEAFLDAQDGDTLYLEPSSSNYSLNFTTNITKRLVWIGNGYQIGSNLTLSNPLPYSPLESKIAKGNLIITSTASQSIFYGINFISGNVDVQAEASAVQFHRCSFTNDLQLSSSNNLINQCFFGFGGSIFGSGTNNIIKNSIICEAILSQVGAIIDQCFVNSVGSGGSAMPESCSFTNCIVLKASPTVPLSNTFSHCIKMVNQTETVTTFPVSGINNNIENVPVENVFVVTNPFASTRKDSDFRLNPTSPAIGSGIGGVDIGVFGGLTPYRLSGQPPIPIITNFFLSTTGSTESGLSGSVTIQSNN